MKRQPGSLRSLPFLLSLPLFLSALGLRADEPTADQTESLPAGAKVVGLEVHPQRLELARRFAYAQLLVTGKLESGERADLTRLAKFEASQPVLEVSPRGVVAARADGDADLRVSFAEHSAVVPVSVRSLGADLQASFVQDVMPILSRLGCNAGTCHGSANGKNGFKLSLRGNDPVLDHRALTDDLAGRRFNRAAPDQSLFLLKPTGSVPHVGGVVLQPSDPYYAVLRAWVAQGLKLDLEAPRVVRLEIFPKDPLLPLPGMKQQFAVLATYADGRTRDVTSEAFIESSNTEVTAVDKQGLVTALRRGDAAVLARYEGSYAATPLFVMGDRSGFEWKDVPEHNSIDTLVYKRLKAIRTLPSDLATDAEFLRRLYLDLTGLPPTAKELRIFLADRRESRVKRDEASDRLIGSAEFVEYWTNKWSDLLQVNPKFLGAEGAQALREWVRQALASNMPYNEFVYQVLASSGPTLENPPAAYYKVLRAPDVVMENTTQLFLGIRFNCNKCHDHPFERWTQGDHWELAAFFAQVGRKNVPGSPLMPIRGDNQPEDGPAAINEVIFDKDSGEVVAPYSGQTVAAVFPFEHAGQPPEAPKSTRRERLTRWITAQENPYFARSFVNRLWSYLLGVGIIEPVDDIRAGNPPSNPELLDKLTQEFIASGFDVRHMLRLILKSRVYQHSIQTHRWNEDDSVNFSHAVARRLPAETLYDAIHVATGAAIRLPGVRSGTRAAELADPAIKPNDGFLDLFGRPPRESACECERSSGVSLGQALNLVNGPTVSEALRDPQNRITNLIQVEKNPRKLVDELFVSILCRPPTGEELEKLAPSFNPRDLANSEALTTEDSRLLAERWAAWEKAQKVVHWQPVDVGITRSAAGASLSRQPDGSVLAGGASPDKDTYTIVGWTDVAGITGLRLEVLPDPSLKGNGPGRADSGNFVLSELRVAAAPAADPAAARKLELQNASADFSQGEFPVGLAIDGKPERGWAVAPQLGRRHEAVFETKEDFGSAGGTILTFTLEQQFGSMHTIGRLRLWATKSPRPVQVSQLPEAVVEVLLKPQEQRTPEDKAVLFAQYIAGDAEMADRIRLSAAQDLGWALINSPAFLFNR
jgi:hypothetical protein